ncbi:hypothetical protein [Parabacteroides sp.]
MKVIALLSIILFLASCSVRKQAGSSRQQTDSLRQTSRLAVQMAKIPESRARLIVPVATLKELPPTAAFVQKSGQATAEIRFLRDTLFVSATCDSLQSLVCQYEEQIEKLSRETQNSQKTSQQKSFSFPFMYLLLFLFILFAGKYLLSR